MAVIIFALSIAVFGVVMGLAATNVIPPRVANSLPTVRMQRGIVAALMATGGVVLSVGAAVSAGRHRYLDIGVAALLLLAAAAVLLDNHRDHVDR
jgi:hypothetical protein